ARPRERYRLAVRAAHGDLLVLGAHPPLGARLGRGNEIVDQLVAPLDLGRRTGFGDVLRHRQALGTRRGLYDGRWGSARRSGADGAARACPPVREAGCLPPARRRPTHRTVDAALAARARRRFGYLLGFLLLTAAVAAFFLSDLTLT